MRHWPHENSNRKDVYRVIQINRPYVEGKSTNKNQALQFECVSTYNLYVKCVSTYNSYVKCVHKSNLA